MSTTQDLIEWAVASRPLAGQDVSGDLHLVAPHADGVLVAVVDSLGHGAEAAATAHRAMATVQAYVRADVVSVIHACHHALLGTRGVVMSVASFSAHADLLTWVGVGDVEAVILHAGQRGMGGRDALPLRGGVIGYQLPPLRASTLPISRGDLAILATDGLRHSFLQDALLGYPVRQHASVSCQQLADALLAQHGKSTDDALVLVAQYRGARG